METKLTKAPKWTNEVRSKLRATDSRVYEPEIARGNNDSGAVRAHSGPNVARFLHCDLAILP